MQMFGRKPPTTPAQEPQRAPDAPATPAAPVQAEAAPDPIRPRETVHTTAGDAEEAIRERLFKTIDPGAALRLPRERLREEVQRKVSEIASEERLQLNEREQKRHRVQSARRHGRRRSDRAAAERSPPSPIFSSTAQPASLPNATAVWNSRASSFATMRTC